MSVVEPCSYLNLEGAKEATDSILGPLLSTCLTAAHGSKMDGQKRTLRFVAIIASHLNSALRTDLIRAERQTRDPTEQQLLHCRTFVAAAYLDHPPRLEALAALLLGPAVVLAPVATAARIQTKN